MNIQDLENRNKLVEKFLFEKKELQFVYSYRFEIKIIHSIEEVKSSNNIKLYLSETLAPPDRVIWNSTAYMKNTPNQDADLCFSIHVWSLSPIEENTILFVKFMLGSKLSDFGTEQITKFDKDANNNWRVTDYMYTSTIVTKL